MQVCLTYSDLSYEKMLNVDTLHCLHTLQWQFDKNDIKIVYTPPRTDKKFEKHLSEFGEIVHRPRFELEYVKNLPSYEDRFWVSLLKDKRAIFADGDIEFSQTKKIEDLYSGNYDLYGSPDHKWIAEYSPLYCGHVLLYDNYYHQKIIPYLRQIASKIVSGEIPHHEYDRIIDEYMVTYITEKYFNGKIVDYSLMPWAALNTKEENENAYIRHGSGRKNFCVGNPAYVHDVLSDELYELTWKNQNTVYYKHLLERLVASLITFIEEDNPDVSVYCELSNNEIIINFGNIETIPSLLQKFSYYWTPWIIQFKQYLDINIQINLKQ